MSESNNHKLPKSDAEVIEEFDNRFVSHTLTFDDKPLMSGQVTDDIKQFLKTLLAERLLPPQATDKGCCDRCHCNKDCILQGAENCCHNGNCPCHKDSTPSLSEREGWEKDFDERYRNLLIVLGISEEKKVAGITQSIWAKDFIRTLLSQTLSNERQRIRNVIQYELDSGVAPSCEAILKERILTTLTP